MANFRKIVWVIILSFLINNISAQDALELFNKNKDIWLKQLTETSTGLKFMVIEPGKGENAKPGDMVAVHYIGALSDNSIFDNSYERDEPLTFNYGVGQVINGWDEGIGLLKSGGKGFFVVPPNLGYGKSEVLNIPPNSTLYFLVELVAIQQNEKLKVYDTKGKDTLKTQSGIQYIIIEEGEGEKPSKDNWAYFHFTGYLPSGQIFDASVLREEPVRINPGQNEFIPAWDEIVQLMKPGAKFHVIVPPSMAYGKQGLTGIIAPNTTLRFDMELLLVSEKREVKPFDCNGKDTIQTESGLKLIHITEGSGIAPKENDVVKIHFTGYLENGEMFQSSLEIDDPVIFAIGQQQVIDGLDEAVKYIKPGGTARVIIPWELGYGEEGYLPIIPEKENLTFDVELISVVE